MSWYGNRLPNFVKAPTEEKLRNKLAKISIGIEEKLEIVEIYPRGGNIVAWYFLDISKAGKLPPEESEEEKVTKKITKRKKARK